MNIEQKSDKAFSNSSVDIVVVVKSLWQKRRFLSLLTLVFAVLGILVALGTPNYYKAASVFIPANQSSDSFSSNFGGLADLAGLSLGDAINSSDQIPPNLYPRLASSTDFLFKLVNTKIYVPSASDSLTYQEYYRTQVKPSTLGTIKDYTLGLPRKLKDFVANLLRGNSQAQNRMDSNSVSLTEKITIFNGEETLNMERISLQMDLVIDKRAGYVTITFQMADPFLAAQMVENAVTLLQNEIKSIKNGKAKEQLMFVENQMNDRRNELELIQNRLALFKDKNLNIYTNSAQNQLDRLETEYNIAFSVYSNLANQYEQAKLKVSKDTPIFTVIQSTSVPVEKAGPHRTLIFIKYIFIGAFLGLLLLFFKSFKDQFLKKWNSN